MNNLVLLENLDQSPNEKSFPELFNTFTRQLIAFFRANRCQWDEAEDLAQEVMLKVYLKASQLRDPKAFRAWLFTIAKNALFEHHGQQARRIETVTLEGINQKLIAPPRSLPAARPLSFFTGWPCWIPVKKK